MDLAHPQRATIFQCALPVDRKISLAPRHAGQARLQGIKRNRIGEWQFQLVEAACLRRVDPVKQVVLLEQKDQIGIENRHLQTPLAVMVAA